MYVYAYIVGGHIAKLSVTTGFFKVKTKEEVDTMIMYYILGMLLGARSFYVFIYNWDFYKIEIIAGKVWKIFAVWEGGLSYHGAVFGMIIAGYLFGKRRGISLGQMMDVLALSGAQGLALGKNRKLSMGELYGRRTDAWIGMVFKNGPHPRHPSQLYQGLLEGLALFIILWLMKRKQQSMVLWPPSILSVMDFFDSSLSFLESSMRSLAIILVEPSRWDKFGVFLYDDDRRNSVLSS